VEVEDKEEDLQHRAPIVTVMGHVDHGKTSLLDYVRKTNVIAGESGGITQHIGAYSVKLDNGQRIAFLDTPGHEAFTAMRARGAQVTDIAIIVIAADDDIMPQTKEAISHAQAAGVPIIFAINKIDKPDANPDKIKERLAGMNLLIEEWGGKIQSQDISAKKGIGVQELLEKVLLEAELLELKANPNKPAVGTVVEAFLDKGKGYVSTVLVQAGTLRVGDYVLAGKHHGKVRAMNDERGKSIKEAGPSTPISILGLDGAPTAGDKFSVFEEEKEAKQIASKRAQLMREQSVRAQKHVTLAEIGRRIALGQFKELNVILKGDVDGSVEALSDSFSKLSTEEVQINIIHKGVGAITESDVLLASASDAIIIGFNVRPIANAKMLAEKEEIDIRNYSIIYDAIDDLKDAMEGMLSPEMKEEVTGTAEVRELFKISKVGTIAGCMVTNGKIFRNSKIRLIREGVVIYTGELATLKRFKDDVKEVSKGYDCGMQIKNYNDLKEYDTIEAFHEVEVRKKLK
jgi:translation initiation factor IF-2